MHDSNDDNLVTHQCSVHISIGVYHDEILCDVVNMDCTHILLGRPWILDKKVRHDGLLNTYSFNHDGRIVTLLPLSPQEVL